MAAGSIYLVMSGIEDTAAQYGNGIRIGLRRNVAIARYQFYLCELRECVATENYANGGNLPDILRILFVRTLV